MLPKDNSGKQFQRSIFAIKDINIGERITHENIRAVRPNNGIDASQYFKIIGRKIKRKIKKNNPLLIKYL